MDGIKASEDKTANLKKTYSLSDLNKAIAGRNADNMTL